LEIRDALLMTVFTAGIPKTINAFKVFHDVLAELKIEPQTAPPAQDAGDDVYERGLQKGRAFMGEAWDAFMTPVKAFDEGAAGHLLGDVFGRIFLRPYLNDRIRALVLVASLTALEKGKLLRLFLPAALRAGATREEIAEIIYQMHGYAGWTGIMDAMEVYREYFGDKA
jgi:4-carboxymuconolactone decarboxylase